VCLEDIVCLPEHVCSIGNYQSGMFRAPGTRGLSSREEDAVQGVCNTQVNSKETCGFDKRLMRKVEEVSWLVRFGWVPI